MNEPSPSLDSKQQSETPKVEELQTPHDASDQGVQTFKLLPTELKHRWSRTLILASCILLFILWGGVFLAKMYSNQLTRAGMDTPTINRIRTIGKIVIGTEAQFPPMEFIDKNNEYSGFDIELGERLAAKLGVKAEFKNIQFDNFVDELNSRNVDVVISAVSITAKRKSQVLFSDSYLDAGQVILTRKTTNDIASTKDLAGKKIAVQKGTTNEEQARSFTDPKLVLLYDDYTKATAALLNGKADAIFADLTGAKGILAKYPGLKVASDPFTDERYGVVMRKGSEDLALQVNSMLNDLRQQGILAFLKQKWLD